MKPEKRPICLELAFDMVEQIFNDLCRERKFEAAGQALTVMKSLVDLSNMLEGKNDA